MRARLLLLLLLFLSSLSLLFLIFRAHRESSWPARDDFPRENPGVPTGFQDFEVREVDVEEEGLLLDLDPGERGGSRGGGLLLHLDPGQRDGGRGLLLDLDAGQRGVGRGGGLLLDLDPGWSCGTGRRQQR